MPHDDVPISRRFPEARLPVTESREAVLGQSAEHPHATVDETGCAARDRRNLDPDPRRGGGCARLPDAERRLALGGALTIFRSISREE